MTRQRWLVRRMRHALRVLQRQSKAVQSIKVLSCWQKMAITCVDLFIIRIDKGKYSANLRIELYFLMITMRLRPKGDCRKMHVCKARDDQTHPAFPMCKMVRAFPLHDPRATEVNESLASTVVRRSSPAANLFYLADCLPKLGSVQHHRPLANV